MRVWLRLGCLAAAVCFPLGAEQAEPLRIFYPVWVGFGPLFLAQEKGFFAKEGVEVELINNEVHAAAFGGLFSGQVDAVAGSFQDAPAFSDQEEPHLVCVLATDDSHGADGILARKDIQPAADLRGRSVAVLHGSVSHFYLNVLLQEAGLTEADIEVVDIPAEDAGEAFLLQEVDAAVTWEPWLTRGKTAAHGHLLTDSSERPGLIVDGLLTRADVFEQRKDDFRAFARAWDAAVGFYEAHPDEAISIMARHVGGWLADSAVFAETLEGVRFYNGARNKEYFGTAEKPGQIYETMQYAIDVWRSIGVLDKEVAPADFHRARRLGRLVQRRMDMSIRMHVAGVLAALLVTASASQAAWAEPLRIGYLTWVGYGPLYVPGEKGFFAREGVEVELINMAIHEAIYAGLLAGQIDVSGATVDDMLPTFDPEQPYACVMVIDESLGADGIVATTDIRSIADLKGKVVGFNQRTVSQFFLNVLLKEAGLSEADIETVDLTSEDAGNAFLMREVDAAVTWEPWLTQGRQSEHGHLLADTSQTPGLIVDCLLARPGGLDARLAEFRALARAWDAALDYVETHPDEANAIMASNVGGWLEDPAVFAETLKGIRFYDSAKNREYFGTLERPGQIYQTSQYAIDFWRSLGALKVEVTPAEVIRHDIWLE